MGRRGGTELGSEVLLALCHLSSGLSFLNSQLGEGREGTVVLSREHFLVGSV